jgi:hypothetical protein
VRKQTDHHSTATRFSERHFCGYAFQSELSPVTGSKLSCRNNSVQTAPLRERFDQYAASDSAHCRKLQRTEGMIVAKDEDNIRWSG